MSTWLGEKCGHDRNEETREEMASNEISLPKHEKFEETPRVGVQLGRRHIQRTQDAHCKLVKRNSNMRICKQAGIHEEEI